MKRFFFTLFLIAGVTLAYANTSNTGLSYDGPWLSTFDSIVINEDSLQFVTITMDDEDKQSSFLNWSISGDLKVNPDYSPNATSIQISSHGPGKGRLTYNYNKLGCGSMSVGINIYKRFNPNLQPYNIEISGPDCILEGDTVVFSIDPILTKNLTQGIGVDEYFWTFTPGLVQEHIYKAGDNSSVTFVAGAVTGNDSIKVQVGIANASDPVSKTLGKAAPKPTINPICVPYGIADVQVSVAEPVENVMYSWTCNDDEWGFKPQIGSEVTLIPGNTSSPIITVTAYYEGGEACRASQTTMKVSRSWANNVSVESDTVPYRFGNEYNFTVTGGATGGGLSWTPPAGWKVIYQDGKEVIMKPDTADKVKLHDSLFVEAALTCAEPGVDRRRYDVYVKPAKVTEITDNGCLIVDTTYKFKITDWEAGPKASTYKWLVGDEEKEDYKGDSLVWKAESGAQTISVIPRGAMYDGEHYYWGDTATFTLIFKPTPPDSIIPSDTCLFIEREIETTLRVHTPILGQTYHWSPITGWDMSYDSQNPNDSSIVTYSTTNALQDEYPIYVYATGEGSCGISTQTPYSIKVDTIVWTIAHTYYEEIDTHSFRLLKNGQANLERKKADWYIGESDTPRKTDQIACSLEEGEPLPQSVRAVLQLGDCLVSIKWTVSQALQLHFLQKRTTRESAKSKLCEVFPNPASNTVNIKLSENKEYRLDIISASGQLYAENVINGPLETIKVDSLSSGIYYFVVFDSNRQETHKVIIQK